MDICRVDFSIMENASLAADIRDSITAALASGSIVPSGKSPDDVFRSVLQETIRDIETHPLGLVFQEFIKKGPHDGLGRIPEDMKGKRITDRQVAVVVDFIYSYMVNHFKGAITEMLACKPCLAIIEAEKQAGRIPDDATLVLGDAILIRSGKRLLKGGDMHVVSRSKVGSRKHITLHGVVEVKSYKPSTSVFKQMFGHRVRFQRGISLNSVLFDRQSISIKPTVQTMSILVHPSSWSLIKGFTVQGKKGGATLLVDRQSPPSENVTTRTRNTNAWRVTLKWSKEAIAEAAYEITMWYLSQVGAVVFAKGVPKGWEEMTPEEAGVNAVRMNLYYAIRRLRDRRVRSCAISLYNSYCFTYALGMCYRKRRRRAMLWPEDLDEIIANGRTAKGGELVVHGGSAPLVDRIQKSI